MGTGEANQFTLQRETQLYGSMQATMLLLTKKCKPNTRLKKNPKHIYSQHTVENTR